MHRHTSLACSIRSTVIATLLLGTFTSAPGVIAQAGNDVPGNDIGPAHPAHIREGRCDDPGDVAYSLDDVMERGIDVDTSSTPDAESESATDAGNGIDDEDEFATNTTILDVSLDDLLGDEYAIAVQESDEESDTYIACGAIEGNVEDDTLLVTLDEMNDSGFSGEAALIDNADDQTSVTITLSPSEESGTPTSSPES